MATATARCGVKFQAHPGSWARKALAPYSSSPAADDFSGGQRLRSRPQHQDHGRRHDRQPEEHDAGADCGDAAEDGGERTREGDNGKPDLNEPHSGDVFQQGVSMGRPCGPVSCVSASYVLPVSDAVRRVQPNRPPIGTLPSRTPSRHSTRSSRPARLRAAPAPARISATPSRRLVRTNQSTRETG